MNFNEIESIYRKAGVNLIKNGSRWKALCPFHIESEPSFVVFSDDGSYKCFGCGEHGKLFDIVTMIDDESGKYLLSKIDIDDVEDKSNVMIDGLLDDMEKKLDKVLKSKSINLKQKVYDMFDLLKLESRFKCSKSVISQTLWIKKRFAYITGLLK